ncbi:hypothetical protein Q2T40_01040 [Winogradskyella maritima]|nr:hypothetical protein [Winogradskyella maritima]
MTTESELTEGETEEAIAFNEKLQTEGKFEKDWMSNLGWGRFWFTGRHPKLCNPFWIGLARARTLLGKRRKNQNALF